jgi:hypothetical protein
LVFPAKQEHLKQGSVRRGLGRAVQRLREARVPFRAGQVVVGDDSFNGKRQGTVVMVRPPHVGLRIPGTPAGTLVFFDYRNVQFPE